MWPIKMLVLESKFRTVFLSLLLNSISNAKVLIVVDQKIERCSTFDEIPYNDLTKLFFIPVNDTHTFMNGTWTFKKDINSPWVIHFFAEHYVQGQWLVQAYDRKYKDFCESLKNPMEPWYFVFKDIKGCPISAGTKWKYDMVPIQFSPILLSSIPRHYMGRWRFTADSQFLENGVKKSECTRGFADIFED